MTDHQTSFFPTGRDRGVTVAVEGFFAFAWFGWGQANRSLRLLGVLLIGVAAAALATGLASATAPSTVTGAGAVLCLLAFGLVTLLAGRPLYGDPSDGLRLPRSQPEGKA